jgi:hypothetical protein
MFDLNRKTRIDLVRLLLATAEGPTLNSGNCGEIGRKKVGLAAKRRF